MPEFPINWNLPNVNLFNGRNRTNFKLMLNDEWTIVLEVNVKENTKFGVWPFNSIEIHRKNTTGEFLVSGELKLFANPNYLIFQTKFSQLIEKGSLFTQIHSEISFKNYNGYILRGFVNISDISVKQSTSLDYGESKERIQLKSLEELSKDLERVLNPESSCFADVTLKCGGASIPAHKIILSARSPVFATMFAHPMKESRKNEVDITDIDVSVLRALLMYMYTGKTSDLTASLAADLLFAADKYQLQDLKTVCTYFLKNTVSLQTMWKILVLGDMHSEELKSFAVDYICNKSGEFSVIESTEEWKSLRKERPDLAMDLLESLVKYRYEKMKR